MGTSMRRHKVGVLGKCAWVRVCRGIKQYPGKMLAQRPLQSPPPEKAAGQSLCQTLLWKASLSWLIICTCCNDWMQRRPLPSFHLDTKLCFRRPAPCICSCCFCCAWCLNHLYGRSGTMLSRMSLMTCYGRT